MNRPDLSFWGLLSIEKYVEVDIDVQDLEENGWIYVDDGAHPDDLVEVIRKWHDFESGHLAGWKLCDQQPCRAILDRL